MSLFLENHINIENEDFVQLLCDCLPVEKRESFLEFSRLLQYSCHHQLREVNHSFHNQYGTFNPSNHSPAYLSEWEEQTLSRDLIDGLQRFLEQAGYERVSEHDILDILHFSQQGRFKIRFPLDRYQNFLVYFSGKGSIVKKSRSWKTLWLKTTETSILYYKKLIVIHRSYRQVWQKGRKKKALFQNPLFEIRKASLPQPITLKLFDYIPYHFLPMIFPGAIFKFTLLRKITWLILLLLSIATGVICGTIMSSPWYALLALIPFSALGLNITLAIRDKEKYLRSLLSQFYASSAGNNHGVLSSLMDHIEKDLYTNILLVFHAFARKELWSFKNISSEKLAKHLQDFVLEYCGCHWQPNIEQVITIFTQDHFLITPQTADLANLESDANTGQKYIDIGGTRETLPTKGIIEISNRQNQRERKAFFRDEYLFHLSKDLKPVGLRFSHEQGAAIRWLIKKPYELCLEEPAAIGNQTIEVSSQEIDRIPLQGIGKIFSGDDSYEFRYVRHRNSNQLSLIAGLRYPHTPSPENPILVRPILPKFNLLDPLPAGSEVIPLPVALEFPLQGIIRISSSKQADFISSYVIWRTSDSATIHLSIPLPQEYEEGALVQLSPPVSRINKTIRKGSWLVPVNESKHFSKRGMLILSAGTVDEERIPFYREALMLELETPLEQNYSKNSLLVIDKEFRTKILQKASKGQKHILIHGLEKEIEAGKLSLDNFLGEKEVHGFSIQERYLYLEEPTAKSHFCGQEVWEGIYESPMLYEAFQGSHLITVENASSFPLRGNLEIHFNGSNAIKEVMRFQRSQGSNTLILAAYTKRSFPKKSKIEIHAVEVTAKTPLNYQDKKIQANFSCVPSMPLEGKFIIEPGSHKEEVVEFSRYPSRFYLMSPLQHSHQSGTSINLAQRARLVLKEGWEERQERIYFEFAALLPERGSIIIENKKETETIWYRKRPNRIVLGHPCRYPHDRGGRIFLPNIQENVRLADPIERGAQKIVVENAQELPLQGRLQVSGLFHSIWVDYIRVDNTLYLKKPIDFGFSKRAQIIPPELCLYSHLSEGSSYAEVSNAQLLPSSGECILEKVRPSAMYKSKMRRNEKLSFRYNPYILWLDTPLKKQYPIGTKIFLPDLEINGAGNYQAQDTAKAVESLKQWLKDSMEI